jgi:hypothetical protein
MRIAQGVKLFVGIKVDQKIREQLEACSEIDKRYFASNDPAYLLFLEGNEGERYLGRAVDQRLSTDEIEDVTRNVLSILRRIAPSIRPERALVILPFSPAEPGVVPSPAPGSETGGEDPPA